MGKSFPQSYKSSFPSIKYIIGHGQMIDSQDTSVYAFLNSLNNVSITLQGKSMNINSSFTAIDNKHRFKAPFESTFLQIKDFDICNLAIFSSKNNDKITQTGNHMTSYHNITQNDNICYFHITDSSVNYSVEGIDNNEYQSVKYIYIKNGKIKHFDHFKNMTTDFSGIFAIARADHQLNITVRTHETSKMKESSHTLYIPNNHHNTKECTRNYYLDKDDDLDSYMKSPLDIPYGAFEDCENQDRHEHKKDNREHDSNNNIEDAINDPLDIYQEREHPDEKAFNHEKEHYAQHKDEKSHDHHEHKKDNTFSRGTIGKNSHQKEKAFNHEMNHHGQKNHDKQHKEEKRGFRKDDIGTTHGASYNTPNYSHQRHLSRNAEKRRHLQSTRLSTITTFLIFVFSLVMCAACFIWLRNTQSERQIDEEEELISDQDAIPYVQDDVFYLQPQPVAYVQYYQPASAIYPAVYQQPAQQSYYLAAIPAPM